MTYMTNTEKILSIYFTYFFSLFGHPDPLDPPVAISIYHFKHRLSQHMHAECYVSVSDVSIYILTQEGFSHLHACIYPFLNILVQFS